MNTVERQRLEAVLPFYVNGRVEREDRSFIERLLQTDPEAAAMLRWHEDLAEHVRQDIDGASDTVGWAALASKVRGRRKERSAGLPAANRWLARFTLDRWLPRPFQLPVFAAMALVVAVQSVLLSLTGSELAGQGKEPAGTRDMPQAAVHASAAVELIAVNFRDETPERDMRLLLISAGATIVQGPGQLGDYVLSVPSERASEARRELAASKWVNSVQSAKPGAAGR